MDAAASGGESDADGPPVPAGADARGCRLWATSTTFHGFALIVSSRNKFGRAFWLLTICTVFTIVSVQLRKLIAHFDDNPTHTSITVVQPHDGLPIPPLTICTLTKMNSTRVAERYPGVNVTMAELASTSFFSPYSTALMHPAYFADAGGWDVLRLQSDMYEAIGGGGGQNFTDFMQDSSVSCAGQFVACWFENGGMFDCCDGGGGDDSSSTEPGPGHMRRFLAHSGTCFAFTASNEGGGGGGRMQRLPGPVGGLGFLYAYPDAHVEPTAYNSYDEYAVHLYMSPADALLEKNPIALPIGYHAHVSLQATKTVQSTDDIFGMGECVDQPLKYFDNYSLAACQVECLIDTLIEQCGCTGLSSLGRIPQHRVCGPVEALRCYALKVSNFSAYLVRCRRTRCAAEPCERWSYRPTLTVGPVFNPVLHEHMLEYWRLPNGTLSSSLIIGDVYFDEIQYTEVSQRPAFSIPTFVSSIGGAVSLWTGASVITIIHMLYFCASEVAGKHWCASEGTGRTAGRDYDGVVTKCDDESDADDDGEVVEDGSEYDPMLIAEV